MSKRKYTRDEYPVEEREILDSLYENYYQKRFTDRSIAFTSKESADNEVINVRISHIKGSFAIGETAMGQSISIDLAKEVKAIKRLGFPPIDIQEGLEIDVVVFSNKKGAYNGSLAAGYENSLKRELIKSITDNTCAYSCLIENTCPGGFMVDLSGIKCFLPGSLAAANRIIDFESFVGKTVNVMVETYDDKRDIFVVSFKKYLKNIIEHKVKELSITNLYTGTITGITNSGIFVEWDEYYTGLIPADEFEKAGINMNKKSGESISFYVSDFKNPSRIVLKLSTPEEKTKDLQELKDISLLSENDKENKIYIGTVTKVKNFGVFVKLENNITGLIEKDFLTYSIKDYEVGMEIECTILDVELQSSKLYLKEKIENT